MMDLTLILLGVVSYVVAGAVMARANPSIEIYFFPESTPVLPRSYRILFFVGFLIGLDEADTWRHKIGLWSYLICLLAMFLSRLAGQILQRRRMST